MSRVQLELARDLIKAGQYDEARTILESMDNPKAREWLRKLDEMDPPRSARQASQSNSLGLIVTLAVSAAALVVGIAIGSLAFPRTQVMTVPETVVVTVAPSATLPPTEVSMVDATATEFAAFEVTAAAAETEISDLDDELRSLVRPSFRVYCESLEEKSRGACGRWTDEVLDTRIEEAVACYQEYDSIFDKDNFSTCLLYFGIAPIGDSTFVQELDIDEMSTDVAVTGNVHLNLYCEDDSNRNEAYCHVWSQLTYMLRGGDVRLCTNNDPLLSQSAQCFRNAGIIP